MSATENWLEEEALARTLGVTREQVRAHRPHAPSGGVRQQGRLIEWAAPARLWLSQQLGLAISEKNAPPVLPEKTAAPSGIEELTVASAPSANGRHFANPNIIRCRRASGELVDVRVMDSAKYQPTLWNSQEPMKVRAKKSPAGNWWELISREPRWRGRP
jgi:hypothetical protein